MGRVVLDTSVIMKWFSMEESRKQALKILNEVVKGRITLVEPELILYEMVNALWFGKRITIRKINRIVNEFTRLEPEIAPIDSNLLSTVLDLMNRFPITAYDASFIALANRNKIPLITADIKHHQKAFSEFIVPLPSLV